MVNAQPIAQSRWAQARWLVLAPHSDDETLGAGALIADAAGRDRLGGVAFLTDGAASHPASARRLAHVRRAEANRAIRRLTGRGTPVRWIGWRDGEPVPVETALYRRDVRIFAAWLRHARIDALVVTAAVEAHCDHVAAHHFAVAAVRRARRRIALFVYHVWSTPPVHGVHAVRTRAMPTGQRRHALSAHRSQLTATMGPGFRLPAAMRRMPARDTFYLQGIAR